MKSRHIKIILAILIGVAGLYLFISNIEDWGQLWSAITHANMGWLLVAVLLQYVGMVIRAYRWQSFLGEPKIPAAQLFSYANIGFMANGVLPARMGEFIRPFLIWRHTPHKFTTGLATIVVERVFDLLGLLLILGYVFFALQFPDAPDAELIDPTRMEEILPEGDSAESTSLFETAPEEWVQYLALLGGVIFLVLFTAVGFMTYAPALSLRLARFCFKPLPDALEEKLIQAIKAFEKGATTFRRPASFVYCIALTILLWLSIAFSELVVLWAFDVNHVGMNGALFLMVGLCFAVMFPQLPGYIGVYQLAVVAILANTFNVEQSVAGAIAIVMWITQVPPIILMGFICLIVTGIKFSEITHVQEEMPAQEDMPAQDDGFDPEPVGSDDGGGKPKDSPATHSS